MRNMFLEHTNALGEHHHMCTLSSAQDKQYSGRYTCGAVKKRLHRITITWAYVGSATNAEHRIFTEKILLPPQFALSLSIFLSFSSFYLVLCERRSPFSRFPPYIRCTISRLSFALLKSIKKVEITWKWKKHFSIFFIIDSVQPFSRRIYCAPNFHIIKPIFGAIVFRSVNRWNDLSAINLRDKYFAVTNNLSRMFHFVFHVERKNMFVRTGKKMRSRFSDAICCTKCVSLIRSTKCVHYVVIVAVAACGARWKVKSALLINWRYRNETNKPRTT